MLLCRHCALVPLHKDIIIFSTGISKCGSGVVNVNELMFIRRSEVSFVDFPYDSRNITKAKRITLTLPSLENVGVFFQRDTPVVILE